MNKTYTPYGYANDGKVYLYAYMSFPEREIGVVREDEETSLQYFINRFELAQKKVEDLSKSIDDGQNKGSYLMKLIHLKTYLSTFDGLGDFPSLFQLLDDLEENIKGYVHKNREKNVEIKRSLLIEAEEVKENTNWMAASQYFKDLKLKWIKTGSAYPEFEDDLNKRFDEVLDEFYQHRNAYLEEKRHIVDQRIDHYEHILETVKKINTEGAPNAFVTIKNLQDDWRQIGRVPKNVFMQLQRSFKIELDQFFGQGRPPRDNFNNNRFKPPHERKREMCERVEKMLSSTREPQIDEVKYVQNEWKKLGKINHPSEKELNTRFKIACNEIFESHFLSKTARWKYEDFDGKTQFEQLKIKIRLLKETIKQDETDLSVMNDRNPSRAPGEFDIERLNQINKLKTKQRILKKLQDQLIENY